MTEKRFHFVLTEKQATALIEFGAALEPWVKQRSPLDQATAVMDEQMANQSRPWERCDKCDGFGWVEDEAEP